MTAAAALRQLGQPDPAGFVTVEEAARITGESARTWRWRAKVESDAARKGGRPSLAVKAPTARGNGWLLHRSIDKRLSKTLRPSERDSRARAALLVQYPTHAVDLAYRKAYWLNAWAQAGGRRRDAQRIVVEAKRIEGEEFAIGVRSLELWRKAYRTVDQTGQVQGIEALIDGRAIATPSHRKETTAVTSGGWTATSGSARWPRSTTCGMRTPA